MKLSYILFISGMVALSFGTAGAGTITPLPTPKHVRLAALLDEFLVPDSPTDEAGLAFRALLITGYEDLETILARGVHYAEALAQNPQRLARMRRLLSIPTGPPVQFGKREARRIERIRQHGNRLLGLLAKESHLVALLMYRFTQFDLWNDDAAWALVERLRTRPVLPLAETIDSALRRLSPLKASEVIAALDAAPGDRRLALSVLAQTRRLEARHIDEIVAIGASEYEAMTELDAVPFTWFDPENLYFAQVIDHVGEAYRRGDSLTVARVRAAREQNPSPFFDALERAQFDWIDRTSWPGFTPAETLSSKPRLALVPRRDCQDPLTKL